MSDNPTKEIPDSRSFEERVFARFDNLDGRLTALEEKVDSRLRETRPIWEAVLTRLGGVENRLGGVETRLGGVETRLGGVETRLGGLEEEVNTVRHTITLVHEDNLHMRADQRKLTGRVEKLESQSTR
jgi:archaellum component FlaC